MRKFWIACVILIACRMLAAFILPTFDDAFITYRYSANLAAGQGLVYNPGEKVMGTTAPLFALLAAIPALLSVSVPRFFVLFNLLCDLGVLFLVYKSFFKSRTDNWFFLFASLFALDSMIGRISIGGMEADLFLLVTLMGLILYLRGRKMLSAAILAAAYFLRPEAVLMLFIICAYEIYTTRKIPVRQGLVALLVLAVPLACIYGYYGQILPQSVVAKSTMAREPFLSTLKSVFFPDPLFFIMFPLALYGFVASWRLERLYLLTGVWIYGFGLAYILKAPHAWSWYFFSIDAMQLLFATFGIRALVEKYKAGWYPAAALQGFLLAAPVLIWTGVLIIKGRSGVEKNVYLALQKDFDGEGNARVPKETVFFADDIGALGYFTHAYIYDNQKLVTPQAALYKDTYERIIHTRPDYLFVYTNNRYLDLIGGDSVLSRQYRFVRRYAIGGEKDFPADRKGIEDKYKQDYLLFRKNP